MSFKNSFLCDSITSKGRWEFSLWVLKKFLTGTFGQASSVSICDRRKFLFIIANGPAEVKCTHAKMKHRPMTLFAMLNYAANSIARTSRTEDQETTSGGQLFMLILDSKSSGKVWMCRYWPFFEYLLIIYPNVILISEVRIRNCMAYFCDTPCPSLVHVGGRRAHPLR